MKIFYPFFVPVFFLTILESNSQTYSPPMSKDFIILQQQDTLTVLFVFPSAETMSFADAVRIQNKIVVVVNDETVEFFPEDLRGFCYKGSYYESICLVKDTTTYPRTTVREFSRRILNGSIQVYASNSLVKDEEGHYRVITDLYYKTDDRFPATLMLSMNNATSKLISDCPLLSNKIKQCGLSFNDLLAIIQKYNSLLEPKTSH